MEILTFATWINHMLANVIFNDLRGPRVRLLAVDFRRLAGFQMTPDHDHPQLLAS
jgi:hypothetical protein